MGKSGRYSEEEERVRRRMWEFERARRREVTGARRERREERENRREKREELTGHVEIGVVSGWWCVCGSTRGQGLPFTFARVLVRAPTDEPGFQPTDKQRTTLQCVVRALVPTLAVCPPHVCHRRENGLSPLARTCSEKKTFLLAPPHLMRTASFVSQRSLLKTTTQKLAIVSP